ncbi:MAG: helicase-related protein [Chloroflexota bacterium]
MLANEAYSRLAERLGEANVGLVTGEERINERAPVIACTVEMLSPARRGVIVLDEVHWQPTRSAAPHGRASSGTAAPTSCIWLARLMREPLLAAAYGDRLEIVDRALHRAAGLDRRGRHRSLAPATVVVAFSRAAVIALASRIHAIRGGSIGVLYGAMPVAARRYEVDKFVSGDTEILVSTDVLGHGVNLPCRTVLFAETTKFDGIERRDLFGWEVAQIAGRAGRYGLHEEGAVGWLTGVSWLRPDGRVVGRGLQPMAGVGPDGATPAYRRLTRAQIGPARGDLRSVPPHRWPDALEAWSRAAHDAVREAGWLRTAPVAPIRQRLLALGPQRLRQLSPDDAWSFALAPVDPDDFGPILARLADAVLGSHALADLVDARDVSDATIAEAEALSARAAILRWFTRRHPGAGRITADQADALEVAASERVIALVPSTIAGTGSGKCVTCGRETAPWFSRCDECQAAMSAGDRREGPPSASVVTQPERPRPAPRPPLNRAQRRRRARR